MIGPGGVCVTNYHVVNAPKWETLVAMTSDGRVLPVKKVLAASQPDDVAIIQVDADNLVPLALAPDAPVGSRVRVLHHPDGRFYTLTEGMVARYFTTHKGGGHTTMMAITADYARGSSGGPVFDDRGAVVGMVASTTSIYYEEKEGRKENLQMVIKECVPAANVLKLIERK
ncbi:MAG: serine protease [Planctomycetota bacterium]|nr:serine protease [Planctomycetota bacterium]